MAAHCHQAMCFSHATPVREGYLSPFEETPPRLCVATKLRCLLLCKVKMSLGGFWGSLGRRCGDLNIAAAATQAGGSGS